MRRIPVNEGRTHGLPQRDSVAKGSYKTRVFATPELLEAILLIAWDLLDYSWNLNHKELLLLSQGVDRSFQSCIQGSPELQSRLGFKANITSAPFSVPVQPGMPKRNSLMYVDLSKIEGLKAAEFYDKSDRVATVRDSPPTLYFSRIHRQDDLKMALKDKPASFLKMYLQTPMTEHIVLEMSQIVRPHRLEVMWRPAKVTVKVQRFGVLVEMAMSLQNAADDIERIEEAKNWWDLNYDDAMAYDVPEPNEVFDWKEFFSEEQVEIIVGEPEYDIA